MKYFILLLVLAGSAFGQSMVLNQTNLYDRMRTGIKVVTNVPPVTAVNSSDSTGAANTITGSAIYQQTIFPEVPEGGFTFSEDFSANGNPPPTGIFIGGSANGWWAGIKMFPDYPAGFSITNGACFWSGVNIDGTNFLFTSDGLHGETGTAICWSMGRASSTNTVIYRLSEADPADLISEHNGETSAHNGRISTLENRPIGFTTNTVIPYMIMADDYNTNGAIRVSVSNRIFTIWGSK